MDKIAANYETLMRQASMTADQYMKDCARYIDEQFGDGYAQNHPELLAAMIQASAQDFHTACMIGATQDQSAQVAGAIESLSSSVHQLSSRLDAPIDR